MAKRKTESLGTKVCSDEFGVTSLLTTGGETALHRREPCKECPWREDVPTGVFPAEAFRVSAKTAYDAAMTTFACHMSGSKAPAICAGFLLRHSDNNISVRLSVMNGRLDPVEVKDAGLPIYASYREMAVANGVDPKDPVLDEVRANGESFRLPRRRP